MRILPPPLSVTAAPYLHVAEGGDGGRASTGCGASIVPRFIPRPCI